MQITADAHAIYVQFQVGAVIDKTVVETELVNYDLAADGSVVGVEILIPRQPGA